MSFRFSERRRRPACSVAGYSPSERAALWAHSSPDLLIMDGFGAEMLYSGVASPLRLSLRALLRRPAIPALLDQGVGALGGDRVHGVPGPEGRVRLAVRDVGAEATVLEHDRLAADGVVAQLLEGRSGCAAGARGRVREVGEGRPAGG